MTVRKRRTQSQKDPVGYTKSEIIVFVANKDEVTITDIRSHLKMEKNIRNVNVVRKHLSDLVNDKILKKKKAERRGMSDIYCIERSFSEFKACFNYLNDFYKPLFLRSDYAKKLIFSDEFLIYGILNIGIEMFKDIISFRDENKFNEFLEKAKRNGEDVSIKETKEMIENMKNQLKGYGIEDIQNSLFNSKPEDILELIGELFDNSGFDPMMIIGIIVKAIFPDKQRDEMLKIISSSPMALDYFLNQKSVDRAFLFATIVKFYLSTLFFDKNKILLINKINQDQSEFKKNPMSFISAILNIKNVSNDNPLLTILRSYFIVDSFNGNVVDNEYSQSVLKEILLPKVIQ